MAVIRITSRWDDTEKAYVPDSFRLEGDGFVRITKELVDESDPRFIKLDGNMIMCGDYRLRIVEQEPVDIYVCEVTSSEHSANSD